MNGLQEVEFGLLRNFVEVCDRLNLRYYMVCGTALGAIKYNGFIPWDDDIDVAMPRTDYEVFIKKAQELLPKNVFVQNYHTEPKFPKLYTKLRKSDTTYIENSSRKIQINHGVFIDVFPLDGYPSDVKEQKRLERLKRKYKLRISSAFSYNYNLKAKTFFAFERLFGCHKRTGFYLEKLNRLITSYSEKDSAVWCNHGNWQGKLDYNPVEWFGKGYQTEFEGLTVTIPSEYDAYLTQKYGDWRADLSDDRKIGHHYAAIEDLTRPYTDYIEKLENGKVCVKSKEEVDSISKGG